MLFVSLLSPKGKGMDAVKYLKGLKEKENVKISGRLLHFWSL